MIRIALRLRRLACGLLGLLLAACSDPEPLTQIVVVVDSDFTGLSRFEADIIGFEEPTTVRAELDDRPLPRRFSLVHDGGPLGPMAVTIRAYTQDDDEPILIEPRTKIFFQSQKTLMLKIDLLAACVGLCDDDMACIAPGVCVESDEAAVLEPWDGKPGELEVNGPLDGGDGMDSGMNPMPDGSINEAGIDSGGDADPPDLDATDPPDAEVDGDAADEQDAEVDAGDAYVPDPVWPYVPSNVDVDDGELAGLVRTDVVLDCVAATIDSTTPANSELCDATPQFLVLPQQNAGGEVLVVVMSSLSIDQTTTLKITGTRPVVLLVEGDVAIAGTIDASADGPLPGPGGNASCATSSGGTGNDAPTTNNGAYGASGGSGGGFGSPGTASSASGTTAAIAGGAKSGEPTLVPLRGGCSGGAGGLGDGAQVNAAGGGGGGAIQLSVAGNLSLSGAILAGGGGGAPGQAYQGGGGGGGSGGAVLIEASTFGIDPAAVIAVNGGAGGGGQPTSMVAMMSTAGGDGTASTATSTPGIGAGTGGDGGRGAALAGAATTGGAVMSTGFGCPTTTECLWGGGGGGGGGGGRIRIRGEASCISPGTHSPAPSVECESCGDCPEQPDLTCSARALGTRIYSVCSTAVNWSAARSLCQGSGLDLVKIVDAEENAFLTSLIASDAWIGASDAVEGDWRWVDNSQFWSGDEGGVPVGAMFSAWRVDEEPNGSGDCARITSDDWADTDCADPLPFICEHL